MSDFYWDCLTDFSTSTLGLRNTNDNGRKWLNEIIERLNAIEDDFTAINKMFAIQQKIGIAKTINEKSYTNEYPKELYERLEKTLRILMKQRLKAKEVE